MTEEEINYRSLRKIQQMEKNAPALSNITSDFYSSLVNHLNELDERFQKEENTQKKMLLQDEIENIKKLSLSIYELREKKIVLAAVSKARGGNPDINNLIEPEKKLFNSILETMLTSRNNVFENKEVEKDNVVQESNPDEEIKEEANKLEYHNPVVKVDKNVPEFIGTDEKKYFLRKNDLISLPADMSKMLVERGVAEAIDILA